MHLAALIARSPDAAATWRRARGAGKPLLLAQAGDDGPGERLVSELLGSVDPAIVSLLSLCEIAPASVGLLSALLPGLEEPPPLVLVETEPVPDPVRPVPAEAGDRVERVAASLRWALLPDAEALERRAAAARRRRPTLAAALATGSV